jgi:hypothetical protein
VGAIALSAAGAGSASSSGTPASIGVGAPVVIFFATGALSRDLLDR